MEDQVYESLLISDITIEEMRELLRGVDEAGFSERLPVLVVEPGFLNVSIFAGEATTTALNVTLDEPETFGWDYVAPEVEWLEVARVAGDEEKTDELMLMLDATGIDPGMYEGELTIIGVPVARDSPRVVPVTLTVTAP